MKLFFICLFLGWYSLSYSQTVSGRVVDETNQPIAFANVVLLSLPDSTFIQGTVTNNDGNFEISKVFSGDECVQISFVGYETVNKLCTSQDVGVIILIPEAMVLRETVITASRTVHKLKNGNMITDVANSSLSKEHNTLDILKKIPGMTLSKGNLEVFGAGVPIIYINNRKVSGREELAMLDPKSIKDVELITNPGAKYDAEGKAVLKIRTLVREEGWNAKVDLTASHGRRFNDSEAVNLVFKKKGLTLSGIYGFDDSRVESKQDFLNGLQENEQKNWSYDDRISTKSNVKQHNYQVSMDYSVNENHALGIRYDGFANKWKSNADERNVVKQNNELYADVISKGSYGIKGHMHHGNVFYNGRLADKLEIEVNWDYINKKDDQSQKVDEISNTDNRVVNIHTLTESKLYAGKVNLDYNLGQVGRLSVGTEFSKVDIDGSLNNPEEIVQNTKFNNQENKQAGYVMYDVTLGTVSLNAGLRYEAVQTEVNDLLDTSVSLSKSYNDWFPNLSISTSLGSVKSSLSYAVRITRPTFNILNSKTYYANQFMIQLGNPQLMPQQSHNIQASFNYRILNVRLGYSYIKNFIGSVLTSEGNVLINSWKNYSKAQMLNANASASKSFGFWNTTLAIGLYTPFITLKYKGEDYKNNTPKIYVQLNNTLTLPADFGITLDYMYTNGGSTDIWKFKPYHSLDIGLRKSFLDKSLDVSLNANDLFRGLVYKYESRINNIFFYQREDQDTRSFSVSLVYRFNNLKSKYRGTGAANDELRRL